MSEEQSSAVMGNDGGEDDKADFLNIPVDEVMIDTQIRGAVDTEGEAFAALVKSVRQEGILEPVLVMRHNGGYRLVAGERRLRACQKLALPTIPARVLAGEGSQDEILRIQLTENLQREDLDPIDEANAYVHFFLASHDNLGTSEINNILVTYQRDRERVTPEVASTVDAIADISGKSISSLRNRLTLLWLPEEVQTSLRKGEIPRSQGYILAENPEHPDLLAICQAIIADPVTNKELKKRLAMSANAAKGGETRQAKPPQPFKGLYTNLHLTRTGLESGTTAFERSAIEALLAELKAMSAFLEERLQADAATDTVAVTGDSPDNHDSPMTPAPWDTLNALTSVDSQDTPGSPAPEEPVTPEV